jgi:hypothetical protein
MEVTCKSHSMRLECPLRRGPKRIRAWEKRLTGVSRLEVEIFTESFQSRSRHAWSHRFVIGEMRQVAASAKILSRFPIWRKGGSP